MEATGGGPTVADHLAIVEDDPQDVSTLAPLHDHGPWATANEGSALKIIVDGGWFFEEGQPKVLPIAVDAYEPVPSQSVIGHSGW